MKAKISIRFISSLLCMAMVFGIFTLNVFASETAISFDNGSSTFEAGRENYGSENVGNLWKGINAENGSEDSILFDYDYVVNAAASTGIYNSVAEEGFEIGTDKSNAGEITVEIYVSIYGKNEYGEYVSHDIRRSASFGYSEYDLKGNPRDNYLCWSFGDYNTEFITISGGGEDLSISISGTLKDIAAHMKENGSDVEIGDSISVGVVVNGRAYYNRAYGTVDYKSEYVDSVWMTVHDAHSREVIIEDFPAMSMKNAIEVVDVPAEEYEGFYEPVKKEYTWIYEFRRMGEYDESLGRAWGDLWPETDGVLTETVPDGTLYGIACGTFNKGESNVLKISELLNSENREFIESLVGIRPSGDGGQVYIDLICSVKMTFADGEIITIDRRVAHEMTHIVAPCIHSCEVCGFCTEKEETLACNYTAFCVCEEPSVPEISVERIAQKDLVVAGTDMPVSVTVDRIDVENSAGSEFLEHILKEIDEEKAAEIFEINVFDEYGNPYILNQWGDMGESLTMTVAVSSKTAKAVANGDMVLYHISGNGHAEEVPAEADVENSTVTFTWDEFSPFVLAEDDSFRFFGREALAKLSNSKALLHAYDQLVKGVESAEATISVSNGTDPLSPEEFVTVMDTYIRDYAHHFWLGNGYSYSTSGDAVVSVSPAYTMSGKTLENAREAFDQKAEEILSGIEDSMSDYEKELYIHDTLAGMIEYTEGTNAHNAYGALVEGKAVCEGYAESFQYLLHRAGIRSFIITGSSINPSTGNPEGHAWNLVRINGNYYHTDLTWNDQGDELFHAYFNQTDAIIEEDHAINATAYALPECTSAEAQYFTGKPEYLSEYTVDSVTKILKNNCYNANVYVPDSPESFITWYGNNIVAIATKAGVIGGFSYGYSSLGREVAVYLDFTCTHPSLTFVPALAPTCTEEGHSEYYKCYCGKWFSDSGAENEITDKNSVIIAAAGHDFGDWETITEATSTTPGEERRECKNCDHYESREIPVKEYSVGDINLDGEVNVKDVYTARLIAAKLIAPTNQQKDLGDVDGDGKITAIDANIIRKYIAHLIGSIPI